MIVMFIIVKNTIKSLNEKYMLFLKGSIEETLVLYTLLSPKCFSQKFKFNKNRKSLGRL
jgi:hypothetical protein